MNTINIIRRLSLTFVILLALVPGSSTRAAAGDAYVSPVGSDLNDCRTPATACATVPAALAKATAGATVYIAVGTYTGSGDAVLVLNKDITLSGGWASSFSHQAGLSTLDGEGVRRVIDAGSNCLASGAVTSSIDRLRIINGYAGAGGAGVTLSCTALTVWNSEFANNYSSDYFGGSALSISGNSTVYMENSLVNDHREGTSYAVSAITSNGNLTVINSTISAASLPDITDAGIRTFGGQLTLRSVTVSGFNYGLYSVSTPLEIIDSIFYGSDDKDCFRDAPYAIPISLGGRNLFGSQLGCGARAEDLVGVDPKLGELADYGGLTPTHALRSDSPARGAGLACATGPQQDQRGVQRPASCSIGAYEPLISLSNAAAGSFEPGQTVTFSMQVSTRGSSPQPDVTITNALSAQFVALQGSAQASAGSVAIVDNVVVWSGTADPVIPVTISFQAQVDPTSVRGLLTNSARAIWAGHTDLSNVVATDNLARQHIPVIATQFCRNFADDFSNPTSGWPSLETSLHRVEYLGGEYRLTTKQAGYIYLMRAPTCPPRGYHLQADVHWQGAAGSDIGLAFGDVGVAGSIYFYTLDLPFNMAYVYRITPEGTPVLLTRIGPTMMNLGSQTNQLGVTVTAGGNIALELNGQWMGTLWGLAPDGLSWVGLAAAPSLSQPVVDARFDNFSVETLSVAESPAAAGAETVAALPELVRPWHSIAPDNAP